LIHEPVNHGQVALHINWGDNDVWCIHLGKRGIWGI